MSSSRSYLRSTLVLSTLIALIFTSFAVSNRASAASLWTDVLTYLPFASSSASANVDPATAGSGETVVQPRVVLTPGTCDTAGPIEVESTGGTAAGVPTAYATLGAAFATINLGVVHTDTINIDVCGDTNEGTATSTINAGNVAPANWSLLSISPAGGAARTISGATTAGTPMIDFNGADGVIINGLNTDGNSLTISNTTASATSGTATIRFAAEATGNTITNSTILGSSSMAVGTNGGTIFFSTSTAGGIGNDNNLISNNNIGPAGANLPTKAIYFNGSTTTTAINNSGDTVTGNNIFDYFGAAVSSAGIYVAGGTTDVTFSNNKFYQTATRTQTTGAQHSAIWISNTSGNNYQVTGNTIGFAAANGTGTYTFAMVASSTFVPIQMLAGTTTASGIQGNTISGIAMSGAASGTTSSGPFRAIYITGLVNVGDISGNTIGSQASTGSIAFTSSSASTSEISAIYNNGSSNWTVNNNIIGGITVANSSTGAANFFGIRPTTSTSATLTASNNIIGGTVANSIQSTSTSASSQVVGIAMTSSSFLPISTITGNTIRNMSAAGGTGTTTSASVIGIVVPAAAVNQTINQNVIFNLGNSNATAATVVTGIQFSGTGAANVVERNLIHSLTSATNSATAEINGIRVGGGTTIYRNNIIAIGAGVTNAIGGAATNSGTTGINGINEALGTDSFFHNSVYIGGSPTAGTGASYAFNGVQTTNVRSFRDNIFQNARSNSGATGKNYAIKINGTAANPAGLTLNNNVYFANGSGGVFGFFNSLDVANLAAWKTAVGQDAGSFELNPQYLDPANTTPNLHINPATPTIVEGNGVDVGVTNDFDGDTRASFTPVDIGADAGNFTTAGDLTPPVITYTALANTTTTTDRPLSITVTDPGSGVPTSGVGLPVLYFRKNAGSYNASQCLFVAGNQYNCTFTYASVGGVVATDTISYYVAAQDNAGTPNVNVSPAGGASGLTANPPAAATPPTTPSSYQIAAAITGTKTVCASGCDYTTLTNAGGIFAAINAGVATGNINILINGDLLTEDGTNGLNPLTEEPVGSNFTVEIDTGVGATRSISGSNAGGLIRLNAADRVIIDGSQGGGGSDRSLTITNTNTGTSSAVIWLQSNGSDGAQNNTIKNINIVGQANTTTLFGVGSGSSTISLSSLGSNNNLNKFENLNISKTQYGIFTQGASAGSKNTGNQILRNLINTASPNNVSKGGIYVGFENNVSIFQNTVSEISQTGSPDVFGISLGFGTAMSATTSGGNEVTNATVSSNTIGGVINSGTFSAYGIGLSAATSGTSTISNNMVYGVSANGTSGDFGAGIVLGGGTGSTTRVYFNSVSMQGTVTGATAGSQTNACLAVTNSTEPTLDIRNNIFSMTQLGNSGSTARFINVALGYSGTVGNYAGLTASNNDYFNSFTNASYFTGGRGTIVTGTTFLTLANWQAETGRDSASINGNPFFLAANNLHIDSASGSTVNNAGTPIAGITTDIDNDVRNVTTPDIGADEFTPVSGPGTLQFSSTTYGGNENTSVQITVTRTLGNSGPVSVDYASADISANGGGSCGSADYISTGTQTLMWADGDSATKQFNVTLCPDGVADPGETFSLTLTNATGGAAIGANNPATVTITDVPPPVSGTVTVGSGGTYTSLTNAGGLFSVINAVGVSGAVTVNITSDLLAETGTNSLNQFAGGSLTIQPSGGAPRLVSGTNATALINLNGADGVTFNGLNTGGNSLAIRNTDTTGATIRFIADASGNTLQNCIIEGASTSTTSGVVAFSTGTTTGNDNNIVTGNVIRDRSDAAGVPANLVYSQGTSAAITNTGNSLSGNTLKNFTNAGVNMTTTGNESWTVNGNTIFEEASRTSALTGIIFSSLGTNAISQNVIRDLPTTSTSTTRGMLINDARSTAISRNRIYNMFESTGTLIGIEFGGSSSGTPTATFVNNMISLIPSATASQNVYGLYDNGFTGNTMNNYFNSVYVGGTASGGSQTYACRRGAGAPTVSVWTDNICFNDRVLATGNSFAMGDTSDGTGTITLNFNVYVGKGVSALSFFDRGTSVTPVTFSAWQTGGRDGNSSASNPGGAYTLANMFVSSADLHASTSFSNPAGNSGTPVAGITDDFDGEVRSVSAPDIGADEFSPATNPSGVGNATPSTVPQGGAVTLSVTVTPGTNPTSTGITVTGDLSSIGGSATQQLFDDGTNGDTTGGDNIFTFATSVSMATTPGAKNLGINISDAQARMATANISLTVTSATAPMISVTPGTIPFGNQPVGTTSSGTTVTITNTGTADLSIGTVAPTGTNSGDFAVVTMPDNPSGATIMPGNSVMFQVTFSPGAAGSRVASLSIPNNSANNPGASIALSGTGTQPGTLALSSATYGVSEGVGMATITVTRTGGTDGTVGISYGTSDGTATGGASCTTGVDYIIPTPGNLSWTNGDSAVKTFDITVCDDSLFESSETTNASITTPTGGATLGSPNTAVLTISENDTAPTLQFSSATYSNNDDLAPGVSANDEIVPEVATITVTRTGATENAVSVNYATVAGGSATGGMSCGTGSGVDYVTTNGTLNFAAGVTMQTFNVTVCTDSRYEGDETVNLALSSPTMPGVLGMQSTSVMTIVDNDTVPTLQFSSATYSNSDDLNSVGVTTPEFAPSVSTITVTRTGAVDNAVTVDFATMSGGTATAGASCTTGIDYISTNGTLSFAAGVISQTFNVTVCTDTLFEGDETVNLALSNPSLPATLGMPNAAVLTIVDNETVPTFQFSSATYSVGEGGGTATITVNRTGGSANAVSVNYAASNGTATGGATCTAGIDYQNTSGTLNFLSGDTSKTFTVPICDDALSEGDETVNLMLSSPTAPAVLGAQASAILTITDNDGAPSLQFSTSTDSVGEAGGTITLTVTRTGATGNAVSVNYATAVITATSGASCTTGVDFVSASGTLNFASGVTMQTFNVTICNDNLFESSETFSASLNTPGGGAVIGAPSTETVTITENDTAPSLQFSSATDSISEAGGTIMLTVTRTGATENAVSVNYGTAGLTATSGASCTTGVDFIAASGTLNFASGINSQSFNVTICNDNLFENNETFTASLNTPGGSAVIGTPSTDTVTITENDTAPTLQFNSATYSNNDDLAPRLGTDAELSPEVATITVTRTGATENAVSVNFATVAGGTATAGASCTAGVDYISTNGTLNFAAGNSLQTFNITVCTDLLFEGDETVNLAITGPSAPAVLGTPNTAVLTIVDNETAPTLQFSSATYSNSDDITRFGETTAEFAPSVATITVTRTGATDNAVSVNYATVAGGTATAGASCTTGVDYISTSGTINFAATVTSQTFNVTVCTDALFEGNETVNLALSSPSVPAMLGTPNSAVLTIIDNDAQPSLQFSSATYSVGEAGPTATITVTRTGAPDNAVSVNYATSNGTATGGATCTAGVDYQNTSGTLNFASGDMSKTFTVPICDDALAESSETVNLTLSSPTGAVLGAQSTAVLTITDNDAAPTLQFSTATASVSESAGTAMLTVTRAGATGNAVSVDYGTGGGTATAGVCAPGVDYVATSGTLNFASGETSKPISVTICNDSVYEADQTVNVTLSNATGGATVGTPSVETVTITNDDSAPTVTINDITLAEGNSGTTNFQTTFTISGANEVSGGFTFQTADNTAASPSDYTAIAPTATVIPANVNRTTATLNGSIVLVNGDTTPEANETFFLNGSTCTDCSFADNQGVATITNDDSTLQFSTATSSVSEGAGTATLTVTRNGIGFPVSVDYSLGGGTATGGASCGASVDYVNTGGTLNFAANDTSKNINVTICDDATTESPETFVATLSNAMGGAVVVAPTTQTVTINDNDGDTTPPTVSYTPLTNVATVQDRVLTVTATDNVGVTGVTVVWRNNDGGVGNFITNPCTFAGGTAQNGTWTCTIVSSVGTQTNPGTVDYFVSADDAAFNSTSSPAGATVNGGTWNLYTIGSGGTINVGTINTFANLVVGNGFTFGGDARVSGNVTLSGGLINTGSFKLTLGCGTTISGGGEANYVVGTLVREFCNVESFTFPVGAPLTPPLAPDGTPLPEGVVVSNYSPITATITGGTVGSSLEVKVYDAFLNGFDPTRSISRNWSIIENGNLTADLAFTYRDEDVNGNEADYRVYRYEAGSVSNLCPASPCVNVATNTASVSGVSTFSRWTVAQLFAPTAAPVSLSGRVTDASGNGIRNAVVIVEGGGLSEPRRTLSSSFGYYTIDGLSIGTYLVTINSKRYLFAVPSRSVTMVDDVTGVDFIAEPLD